MVRWFAIKLHSLGAVNFERSSYSINFNFFILFYFLILISGEPNDANGGEKCVEMLGSTSKSFLIFFYLNFDCIKMNCILFLLSILE